MISANDFKGDDVDITLLPPMFDIKSTKLCKNIGGGLMTGQTWHLSYWGDSSPAVYRSLLYPRTRALQVTNRKLTIVITMRSLLHDVHTYKYCDIRLFHNRQ